MVDHIIHSIIGSGLAEIATLPICTLKTNYQNQVSKKTIPDTIKEIYQRNGIRGFYRASVPAVGSQIISSSSKWTFYKLLEEQQFTWSNKFINGCLSGIFSSVITHPIDVIKIHYQLEPHNNPHHNNNNGQKVRIKDLLIYLYRGYSKSLTKAAIGSTFFFPIYEYMKVIIPNPVLSAVLSSIISTTLLHPIDYLKTRHIAGNSLYHDGFQLHKYFKGLSLNLLRVVPHFTIWMTTMHYMKTIGHTGN